MAVIDIELIARFGRLALANDQPYLFTRVVPILAEAQPTEPEWVLGYLRSLVRLGLSDVAKEIIDRFPPALRSAPAFVELAEGVAHAPASRLPWPSRRRRFDANLKALSKRDGGLAESVRHAWTTAAQRYEWHHCADGNVGVLDSSCPWPPVWIPSLDDHRGLGSGRINTERTGILPPPLLFEGVGLGWEILDAYARTRRVFLDASSAIYIVEPHLAAIGIVFHLHDWRALLDDPSVQWFAGDGAADRFRRFLEADPSWPLTDRCCVAGSLNTPPTLEAESAMNQAARARLSRAQSQRQEIDRIYAGRDAAYWAQRFAEATDDDGRATDRPLRVLGITSLHTTFLQYSMRDCLQALEDLGHRTRLLIEPDAHRHVDPIDALSAQIGFAPDLVLILSRMRYEMPSLIHAAVPTVTWDQDALPWVLDEARRPTLAWNDFLMGYGTVNAARKFGWPEHRLMFCTLAGSANTYSCDPIDPEVLAPYRCDVSYVSHASATVDQEMIHAESWLTEDRLRTIFRAAASTLVPAWRSGADYPGAVLPIVLDTAQRLEIPITANDAIKVNIALLRVGDRAFRHVALEWVAEWADRTGRTFHIRGNGWDRHPRLARYAQGPTANGEELRRVYQASAVNLQLMGYGFLHQRALDGLMASAFFMARRSLSDTQGPVLRRLLALVDRYHVHDAATLKRVPTVSIRRELESCIRQVNGDPRILDAPLIEGWRSTAAYEFADDCVPGFRDISFEKPSEFEAQVERFLRDPDLRSQYAARMRETLVDRFSYEARMKQMLRFVGNGFRKEAREHAPALHAGD